MAVASLALAGYLGVAAWNAQRLEGELRLAAADMEAGRLSTARQRLVSLSERWPGRDEVWLQLGLCEAARGNAAATLSTLSRIPTVSRLYARAAGPMSQAAIGLGRIGEAERILATVEDLPGPDGDALCRTRVILLGQLGRTDEAARLLEARWRLAAGPPPAAEAVRLGILRDHIGLDLEPFPLQMNLSILKAGGRAPDGADEVLLTLARAHLATRSGAFDEARSALEPLLARPQGDLDAWKAWLRWAVAAARPDEARRAAAELPASSFGAAELASLQAWFAAGRRDHAAERRALERLIELDPGREEALLRLSVLAREQGDRAAADRYRARKDELDRARDRYLALYREQALADHLDEMAELAGRLGRRFEARAFREISASRQPGGAPAPSASSPDVPANRPPGVTLAEALGMTEREAGAGTSPWIPDDRTWRGLPAFVERSRDANLGGFVFDNGTTPMHQLPEMASGGVALLDHDGDGRLDIYLVQGGAFPPGPGRGRSADRLYRNRGDGTFEDATARSRLAEMPGGYGHAAAVGDYDNDGHPDLFVTRWRSYALYHNRGDGTFEDATGQAGLDGDRDWPTSAAFADLDNDGDLDLYVCHYGVWDPEHPKVCKDPSGAIVMACNPREIDAMPDHVFRNDAGRFVDVTREAGMEEREGRGLGVVAADLDGDGLIDLFVANDTTANYFWRNMGGFRFEERAHLAGLAANAAGGFQAGMGVACGDADGDGRPDVAVTNFYDESTTLYGNLGDGFFADRGPAAGLAAPTRYRLGFGISFLDANNDGRLDLLIANGHVSDIRPLFPFAMPIQLFLGDSLGRFAEIPAESDSPFRVPHVGRGLAVGDLDDDGLVDALIVAQNEPPVLLKNESRLPDAHYLSIRLRGVRSNRDGVGALVTVEAGGRRWSATRPGGGSYASASDGRLHFGLGAAATAEKVTVRWPSGREDRFEGLKADAAYELVEAATAARRISPPRP
ncbi:FG-GAP repeat protein [Aquisphaera giovannonii]|uniref:FG-GAP repeat protein n=1 Tax=Aquisphaera giovannonii TaxID=406548 RepID=A0A5B9W0Y8_9BACT|nr:CRTAC1 family protein [Aquisphaera giovannonii]QEH34312.1 FG-GAP repeat protein [Aquisphaera giovannonii]